MSTNFYVKLNECSCCGRYDYLHIGQRAAGWKFLFHGSYKSFNDWKVTLMLQDSIIEDEYGNFYSLDEFIDIVNGLQGNKSRIVPIDDQIFDYFKDKDGYEFCMHDFS